MSATHVMNGTEMNHFASLDLSLASVAFQGGGSFVGNQQEVMPAGHSRTSSMRLFTPSMQNNARTEVKEDEVGEFCSLLESLIESRRERKGIRPPVHAKGKSRMVDGH